MARGDQACPGAQWCVGAGVGRGVGWRVGAEVGRGVGGGVGGSVGAGDGGVGTRTGSQKRMPSTVWQRCTVLVPACTAPAQAAHAISASRTPALRIAMLALG